MSKSRYDKTWMPEFARGMILRGSKDAEIALALGVSVRTLRKWQKDYDDFGEIFQHARGVDRSKVADALVEAALFKRATGFDYNEIKTESQNGEIKKTTETVKHQAPDLGSQKFWLITRDPKRWDDSKKSDDQPKEIEHKISFSEDNEEDNNS